MKKEHEFIKAYRRGIVFFLLLIASIWCMSLPSLQSSDNYGGDVLSNPILHVHTDDESYEKGQIIRIFGNITNISEETVIDNNLIIRIQRGDWMRLITVSVFNDSYEYLFKSSFGDPEGVWNISVEVQIGQKTIRSWKSITVLLPVGVIRYNVIWFSPSNEAVYYRGSTFDISVFVTENDIGVTNATTFCTLPSFERLQLTEVQQGYFKGVYSLPYDSQTGVWSLSVESITGNSSSLSAGGSNILIHILPVSLSFEIVGSPSNVYTLGNSIELRVHVKYPEGPSVENATVTASIGNEMHLLRHLSGGVYIFNCTNILDTIGSHRISFSASDFFGNNGSTTHILYLVSPTNFEFPFMQIIGFLATVIVAIFLIYLLRQRRLLLRKKNIQNEIEELEHLRNEAALNYYHKGTITRQTYDLLQQEYAKRLAELKKYTLTRAMTLSLKEK